MASLFKELEDAYGFDPLVTKDMVDTLKLQDLLDFAHIFDDSKHVTTVVEKMGLPTEIAPLQIARLRRAWNAFKDTAEMPPCLEQSAAMTQTSTRRYRSPSWKG